eukprot:TRINITY_DN2583_c0_g1_i2.p1 TRINITY_DN2583_c0_g1~~TRINITY_DN2583_c0_g1_i2.p1  ORF type:complete len:714 (+),score=192.82 TRINITY_DN2583_c0_g1_i2:51-2192(+)
MASPRTPGSTRWEEIKEAVQPMDTWKLPERPTQTDIVETFKANLAAVKGVVWGERDSAYDVLKVAIEKQRKLKQAEQAYHETMRTIKEDFASNERGQLEVETLMLRISNDPTRALLLLERKKKITAAMNDLFSKERIAHEDLKEARRVNLLTDGERSKYRVFIMRKELAAERSVQKRQRDKMAKALQEEKSLRIDDRIQGERAISEDVKVKYAEQQHIIHEIDGLKERIKKIEKQLGDLESSNEANTHRLSYLQHKSMLSAELASLNAELSELSKALPSFDEDEKRAMRGVLAAQKQRESLKHYEEEHNNKIRRIEDAKRTFSKAPTQTPGASELRLARDKVEYQKQLPLRYAQDKTEMIHQERALKEVITVLDDQIKTVDIEEKMRVYEKRESERQALGQVWEKMDALKEQHDRDMEVTQLTAREKETIRTVEAQRALRRAKGRRPTQRGEDLRRGTLSSISLTSALASFRKKPSVEQGLQAARKSIVADDLMPHFKTAARTSTQPDSRRQSLYGPSVPTISPLPSIRKAPALPPLPQAKAPMSTQLFGRFRAALMATLLEGEAYVFDLEMEKKMIEEVREETSELASTKSSESGEVIKSLRTFSFGDALGDLSSSDKSDGPINYEDIAELDAILATITALKPTKPRSFFFTNQHSNLLSKAPLLCAKERWMRTRNMAPTLRPLSNSDDDLVAFSLVDPSDLLNGLGPLAEA